MTAEVRQRIPVGWTLTMLTRSASFALRCCVTPRRGTHKSAQGIALVVAHGSRATPAQDRMATTGTTTMLSGINLWTVCLSPSCSVASKSRRNRRTTITRQPSGSGGQGILATVPGIASPAIDDCPPWGLARLRANLRAR
jgi:hypothetical protein